MRIGRWKLTGKRRLSDTPKEERAERTDRPAFGMTDTIVAVVLPRKRELRNHLRSQIIDKTE